MMHRGVGRETIEFRGGGVRASLKSTICAVGDAIDLSERFRGGDREWNERSRRAFQEQCPPDRNVAMYIRILIAAMVYLMVQAIMFGAGIILVLATPLNAMAMQLIPWMVGITALLSLPISWLIAPRLRARYWREKGIKSDFISGPV
jgi:hypothetical protein